MFQQSSSASHSHATVLLLALVAIAVCCSTNNVVVVHGLSTRSSTIDTTRSTSTTTTNDRRSFFKSIGVISGSAAACLISMPKTAFAQETEMRQGIEVNAFNGLAFNYRGGEYDGLDASTLNEPSISYKDFNTFLKSNEVELVEFMAPDGDVAYVTLKGSAGADGEKSTTSQSKRIRIGEGYPLEQHDGFSSPMFCVRTVKNAGVPYKFVVKGLEKYAH